MIASGPVLQRRPSRGFTLVEVLVALFVLALMAAMAWQGVSVVMRSREVASARMDELLRLQSVLRQWEVDLRQVVDTQVVPALSFDGANLRLTRRQGNEVELVTWSLRGQRLVRWSAAPAHDVEALQEAYMRSHQLLGSEPQTLAALDGISELQLYFFDRSSNAWRNAQSSGDVDSAGTAPPPGPGKSATGREALPDGVRLVLGLAGTGGQTEPQRITRDWQLIHP